MIALRQALPLPPPMFWAWVIDGALAQMAATALMLAAMNDRSFVVVYAYIKTEPVQVALFGLVFLGDAVTPVDGGGDPDRHHRRRHHGAQAGHIGGPAARRCSGLAPARCSRFPPSAFAARS